jgi:hypothetical protein
MALRLERFGSAGSPDSAIAAWSACRRISSFARWPNYVEWHLRRFWAPLLLADEELEQQRQQCDPARCRFSIGESQKGKQADPRRTARTELSHAVVQLGSNRFRRNNCLTDSVTELGWNQRLTLARGRSVDIR